MTVETIKLLARYNGHANNEMGRVLAQLSDEEWNRGLGGYYPSIRSLCSHLFTSDLTWLRRFSKLRPLGFASHPVLGENRPLEEPLFPGVADWAGERKALDECIAKLADELTDEDLSQLLRYKNLKGVDQERRVGGLLLHMFNHHTHHRGMIALYLDMLGRKNDFSNLLVLA